MILIELHAANVREIFTGFGRFGASAAKVAHDAAKKVREYLASGVPVGQHLADQLLLPLGIAAWQTGRGGSFRTLPLSRHATTQADLLRLFLDVAVNVEREPSGCRVSVGC